MKNELPARLNLLQSLLITLIDEWGVDVVVDCLNELSVSAGGKNIAKSAKGDAGRQKGRVAARERLTASLMVSRTSLPVDKKNLINILAERYDDKLFLPSSGDIRYFFEAYGEDVPNVRQRNDAFRMVLRLLSGMTESALRKIVDSGAHSGPARLGPLSDAMREVGERRPYEVNAPRDSGQGAAEISSQTASEKLDVSDETPGGKTSDA